MSKNFWLFYWGFFAGISFTEIVIALLSNDAVFTLIFTVFLFWFLISGYLESRKDEK